MCLDAGPMKAWAILRPSTRAPRQNVSPNSPFQIVKATSILWIGRSWAQRSHITPWNCPYGISEVDKMLKYNVISSVLEILRRYSIQQRNIRTFKAVITYNVPTICTILKIRRLLQGGCICTCSRSKVLSLPASMSIYQTWRSLLARTSKWCCGEFHAWWISCGVRWFGVWELIVEP